MLIRGIIPSLAFLLFISCGEKKEARTGEWKPAITFSPGHRIDPDTVPAPLIVTAGEPKTVPAGTLAAVPAGLNVMPAGEPVVVAAGKPQVIIPGTDTFPLPATARAGTPKITPAGPPETVEEMTARGDDNPGNFITYKALETETQNTVMCTTTDAGGNVWFGTFGGVTFYDGRRFRNFSMTEGLPNNFVFSICAGKDSSIWIGTGLGGVCRFDGKSFTTYTKKEGLPNNMVRSIFQDTHGNTWFGTSAGACRFDGKSFTTFTAKNGLAANHVYDIMEDARGKIWIATTRGVSCYDGKTFSNYSTAAGLPDDTVFCLLQDRSGKIWFGTPAGACCFDGKNFCSYTQKQGLINNRVESVMQDFSGRIWFGQENGISIFDGSTFTSFGKKQGMDGNYARSMKQDRTGDTWIATMNGICHFDGNFFTGLTEKEGLPERTVRNFYRDREGRVWMATMDSGACFYDGKTFTRFTEKNGLTDNRVFVIHEDAKGNTWFGTSTGICFYDGTSVHRFTQPQQGKGFSTKEGLSFNAVMSIAEDDSGRTWFGLFGGGLLRYDGKTFTKFSQKQGLVSNNIISLERNPDGSLWIGTTNGASRYDGKTFTNFTAKDGLASDFIYCIAHDQDGITWFGTSGGLTRYDGKSFMNFTTKDGLASPAVMSILPARDGNLWFGTREGLSCLPANRRKMIGRFPAGFDPAKDVLFVNYGYNDGFSGLKCISNSVMQDSAGKIWWGADLLMIYDPAGEMPDTLAPVLVINGIDLYGERVRWEQMGAVTMDTTGKETVGGIAKDTIIGHGIALSGIRFDGITQWNELPVHLSLPYNNNNLTFRFTGVHLKDCSHVKYQYRLDGMDPDWSTITDRTEAPYGNLPPGTYTFELKAMNRSGVWSRPFTYSFEVRPPWWETWWFRISAGLLLLSSVAGFFRYRTAALRKDKERLEKTVKERTAEVVKQKEVIEEKQKDILDSINYAQRIQRALLASDALLDENLHSHFVFFQPKDIVSGDFYWAAKLDNGNFALVTGDSTGHGVPGAIMSMLNISCLEKSIEQEKLSEPADILNHTRRRIIETLARDGSPGGGKDGMDCSLVSFDFVNKQLTYAAANNPVWIVRGNELLEFPADKMPVGRHDRESVPFTQHTVELQKGDTVYTFTDGMPDQFGGPKGKKFMYRRMKELLVATSHLPVEEQGKKLRSALNEWKGDHEQVDDVCVIGVRI